MITKKNDVVPQSPSKGVTRTVLSHQGSLMAVEFRFVKGAIGAVHTHPHEQIGYIAEGSFEVELDGKTTILEKGDSYYVPSGAPHGVVALQDAVIIDVFSPQREDFLSSQPQGAKR